MPLNTISPELQDELVREINARLELIRDDVLDRYVEITGRRRTVQSLHGTIGGKNNTYVDAIRTQFLDFKNFQARWINGLLLEAESKFYDSSSRRIVRLLQDDGVREYVLLVISRTP